MKERTALAMLSSAGLVGGEVAVAGLAFIAHSHRNIRGVGDGALVL